MNTCVGKKGGRNLIHFILQSTPFFLDVFYYSIDVNTTCPFLCCACQKAVLEGRVQDLERTLDRERETWSQRLALKERDMQDMQAKMQRQLEDYESLLDVKLALDMEINSYRKMLEGEEQR